MNTKAEHAAELHQRGCNCAQAVACTFCKEFGISEDDMFRIAEGFAVGCEDSEDTGFCPLRIMWCAPEHLCKQHIILRDRAIDLPLCTC